MKKNDGKITTWNRLWSRSEKEQAAVLTLAQSIHPRNAGKPKPKGRDV